MSETFHVQMIPITRIRIPNPRERNKLKFSEIVSSISSLGLKRPITVSHKKTNGNGNGNGNGEEYDLVCGQGRLEAFLRLGQTEVPAIVIDAPTEDCMLMSLVENLARRQPSSMEHVRQIALLKERGYSNLEIARKINMNATQVGGIIRLLENGEERLLNAVDKGEIPLTVAMAIATTSDENVQKMLAEAYEKGQLKGKALLRARKIFEMRRTFGKQVYSCSHRSPKYSSSEEIVRAFKKETQRQNLLVRKAKVCETYLLIIINALRQLFADPEYVKILNEEKLDSLPKSLASQIRR